MPDLDFKKNDSDKKISQSRRRLAKTAVITPFFMTLLNRPAWGSRTMCTVSGFGSAIQQGGMISGMNGPDVCEGVHPEGYWKSRDPGVSKKALKFNAEFGWTFERKGSSNPGPSFHNILKTTSSNKLLARCFVGLYLDSLQASGFPVSTADIQGMFAVLETGSGTFTFSNGTEMDYSELDQFFNYLFDNRP